MALGRLTPLVRSFISIPAGVLGSPLGSYTALTLLSSAIWCFGFAGVGWAIGGGWEGLHHALRYLDIVVLVALITVFALGVARRRNTRASV